jgi:hypothetical protein
MFQIHTIKNLGRAGYKTRAIVSNTSNPVSKNGSDDPNVTTGITQLSRLKNHKTGGKFYGNTTKKDR